MERTAAMKTRAFVRTVAAGALAAIVVSSGATASAQQTVVVANDDRGPSGPNAFLFNAGLVTTGLAYTPALIVAINSDRSEDKYLYAPFAGPFLDLAARDDESKAARTLLVVDGVFQTIGLLQLVASFVFIEGASDVRAAKSSSTWSQTAVAPARLSEDGYGLVAVGQF
jgi:hypothetical protein